MSASTFAVGHENAAALPIASQPVADSPASLTTLQDLLDALATPEVGHRRAMVLTTAKHLSGFVGRPLHELPLEMLLDVGPSFSLYLREHRYAVNSVRTYCRIAHYLLRKARAMGWVPDKQPIADAWKPVVAALKDVPESTKGVVRFAIREGISPADFSDKHLVDWSTWMERRGRKHRTVRKLAARFRRAIILNDLEHLLPKMEFHGHPSDYRVRTADMPEPLRTQVRALLDWKQARFAKGRPQHGKHRAVSALQLESWINRLFGYAKNVAKRDDICTLLDLVTEDMVTSFVEWALNKRNLSRNSMLKLSMIYAVMRYHPDYKNQDWQWFKDLFSQLPEDPESDRLERKARKTLPYHVVATVPEHIRAERLKKGCSERRASWLVHDELLITWLTVLPWRQRNIRECRIGDPNTANLFFAGLPPMKHVAKPKWVDDALAANPKESFWQFHFRESETKTGQIVRGILPRKLITLLEDYLNNHRPRLVSSVDPGTLFLNRSGGRLAAQDTTELVAQLILQHAGRRVTPHLFRDIFAYKWLEDFPEDYLTLSKILWHRGIKTTLKIYGRNFDESNGVRRVDEWLGS